MPTIPGTQEDKAGGLQKGQSGQLSKTSLKIKAKN